MDTKGYYKTLGISESATDDEIKRAYRKMSIKFHPDKQAGKSDAEKAESEKKFKDVNEAYQVLSDPDKKSNYDKYGDPEAKGGGGFNFDTSGFPFDLGDLFGRQFGGNPFGGSTQRPVVPGADARMEIPLTIEDIFNGCSKKLKFAKKVRCSNCHGDGGTGKKTCLHCGGTGRETVRQMTPMGFMQSTRPCQHCNGTGSTIEHTCPTCGGSGFKTSDAVVEVNFPAGMPNGYAITITGAGHESKNVKGPNGDFYAIAKYTFDTNRYNIQGLDVIERIFIPYYDILLGCTYDIEIPNGSKKRINIESCLPEGKLLRLYREGINDGNGHVGDYYVEVHYAFPSELSEDERKKLEDIKVINYKSKEE